MAVAFILGMPLTVRDQRLVVLPAIYNVGELETILDWADVVVLIEVNSSTLRFGKCCIGVSCWSTLSVVERATLPEQVIYDDLRNRPTLKLLDFS